jgi:hypothetical protein
MRSSRRTGWGYGNDWNVCAMAKEDFMQTLAEKWEEKGRTAHPSLLGGGEELDDGERLEGTW